MYKVYGKKNEIVWDAETDTPLIRFTNGVAETDNERIAKKLKNLGYKVEGETAEVDLSEMSVKELKAYAAEKNIDIGNATKKIDIITMIQTVSNH